jgi:tetratricopeptide (TPR) repeat protein
MASQGKHSQDDPQATSTGTARSRSQEQSQLEFELEFFGRILERCPDYVDVLRVQGNNLTLKGRYAEGLQIDKRLVKLRPNDPLAHYNLACSYALLKRNELSIRMLRKAVELGYRDFRYMREDRDLDAIRHDPRFRALIREYEDR